MTEDDQDLLERIEALVANAWDDDEHETLIEARERIQALIAENERSKVETEKMLRAAYRAGYLRASGPNVKYHRNFWDFAPIRAELGFGPRAKKK